MVWGEYVGIFSIDCAAVSFTTSGSPFIRAHQRHITDMNQVSQKGRIRPPDGPPFSKELQIFPGMISESVLIISEQLFLFALLGAEN